MSRLIFSDIIFINGPVYRIHIRRTGAPQYELPLPNLSVGFGTRSRTCSGNLLLRLTAPMPFGAADGALWLKGPKPMRELCPGRY